MTRFTQGQLDAIRAICNEQRSAFSLAVLRLLARYAKLEAVADAARKALWCHAEREALREALAALDGDA